MIHGPSNVKFIKFQPSLVKIHCIALVLLMCVLNSSWVVCIRVPEEGSDKMQCVVPVC